MNVSTSSKSIALFFVPSIIPRPKSELRIQIERVNRRLIIMKWKKGERPILEFLRYLLSSCFVPLSLCVAMVLVVCARMCTHARIKTHLLLLPPFFSFSPHPRFCMHVFDCRRSHRQTHRMLLGR